MALNVTWSPSVHGMGKTGQAIKQAVKEDAHVRYEAGIQEINRIDAELKKGYAVLNQQWGDYWQHYMVLGRGKGGGFTLAKMKQIAMANMEKWQRLFHQREILRQQLKLPRVYTGYFKDRPFG